MSRRTACGVALLLLSAAALSAKGKPKIPWLERPGEAVEQAKQAGKPIAVFLTQEGSGLAKRMEEALSEDPRLEEMLGEFVWLKIGAGSADYQHWFETECGGLVSGVPSLAILSPKGASDPAFTGLPSAASPDPDDIFPVLRQGLARAGKKAPPESAKRVETILAEAKGVASPVEAYRRFLEALRLAEGWPDQETRAEEARRGLELLLQEGNAEMLRVQREARTDEAALASYREIAVRYAETSVADWAAHEAKRLEKK